MVSHSLLFAGSIFFLMLVRIKILKHESSLMQTQSSSELLFRLHFQHLRLFSDKSKQNGDFSQINHCCPNGFILLISTN